MQTGIRQNRKRLFLAKVRSQVIRIAKAQKHKAESLSLIVTSKSEMQSRQTRARQNQKQNQRGVEYNFSIDWLTQNRRKIKINVLTG